MRKIRSIILLSFVTIACFGQDKHAVDSIDGVYIPKDLNDCFDQINSFWNDSTKQQVANWTEEEFGANAHFGFGRWMRNNWGLWKGSRLSRYFNEQGIHHPDDMSGIILSSYHRQLNGREIELKKQIKYYRDYWKTVKKEDKKFQLEEWEEFNIGDTVEFDFSYDFVSKDQEDAFMDDTCSALGVVVGKRKKDFQLLVKLLNACDPQGIIVAEWQTLNEQGELIETTQDIMLEGQELLTSYDIWY